MRLEVFFCYFAFGWFVEEGVEKLKFFFASSLRNYRNEVYKFAVVYWAVKLWTILNHEKYFVGEISLLYFNHSEVLQQFAFSYYVVLAESFEFLLYFC